MTSRLPAPWPLVAFLTALAGPSVTVAADVAWEVRLLAADHGAPQAAVGETLLDLGGDPLDVRLAIEQGVLLANATGLPLQATRDLGGRTVVFPLGAPFTVEPAGSGYSVEVGTRVGESTNGRLVADLKLDLGGRRGEKLRTVPLAPRRARLWVVPVKGGVRGVLVEAWPADEPPAVPPPERVARVELALVRGEWRGGQAPGWQLESDAPTWVDPFEIPLGESRDGLLRPVVAGSADRGTVMFKQDLRVAYGELASVERGRRPPPGEATEGGFVGLTVSVREAPDSELRLDATIALQASDVAQSLVTMRRLELVSGEVHVWLLPAEEHLHALFVRAHRGRAASAQAVNPAGGPS